ncbi:MULTISPECIES: BLUF domain-containing protein [Asticcacaulis]|uniref:BLUF domain-containing protein n=1 Tax=Asticcacaulis TaxID=76890 RepID=UPI001AE5CE31|nr:MULTISPECIES: BLUF domain-containing protein [Asticcacaulis]MBP2160011.1 hypothetical protein [Asticcacaulis solisilvae]MDR6801056.1 hypothetical protein [Asticcacaulis sp. BE141]
MVYQLIYRSRYTGAQGSLSTVREILTASQRNNSRHGITGFLIFDKTSFLQVLEGDAPVVLETYERIKADERHADLSVIAASEVDARAFPDWAMGGFLRSPEVQPIYMRHGLDKGMDPKDLKAETVIGLAHDLMAFEAQRHGGRVIDLLSPDHR